MLIGVMGLLVGVPAPVVGQANPPQSAQQSAELEEVKQLIQQVNQLQKQGQYSAAIPLTERILVILEKNLGAEHPLIATSLNNLAYLYDEQGNYSQAEPLLQRALAIREKVLGKEHPSVATSLNNLAALYKEQGNYSQAEPLYQRALAIWEKVLGQEHPNFAAGLNNLAVLYQDMGNYSQAEPLLQRSLAIREKVLGKEHPDVATSLNDLAVLYQEQGNYSQAEPLLQRALAIKEKVLGKEHPAVATSLNNLAGLYQEQGNYSQAELFYQRALAIKEKVLGKEHPDVAESLNNLAALYSYMGNYSQAEPLFQRSLAILEKVLGKEHPNVAFNISNLAGLYWAQGDITRALEFAIRNTNIEEHNLAVIFTTGSEARKRDYIATLWGKTNANVSLHVQGAPNNPEAACLALTTILQRKGRILDALTDSLQILRQNLKPEDQTLLNQLADTRSQLAALIFNKPKDIPLEQYQQQVATLKAQAEQLENALSHRSAEFHTETKPVTIEAVQQLIPADTALVELVLYKPFNPKTIKRGSPRYVAYILHSTGEPKWIDLGEAAPIDQAVTDFRKALQSQTSDIKPVARALDEKLMQPIRKLLGNTRNVLLSPDSQLNLIPFAALVDENNRYLVENYSINYLSSGRDLLRLQNHANSRQPPVILANPDYDKPGNPSVQIASNPETSPPTPLLQGEGSKNNIVPPFPTRVGGLGRLGQNNRRSTDLAKLQFSPLSGTAQEAAAIAPMLPRVTLLTGSNATENAIKQLQAPTILHIATHGFFLSDIELVAPAAFGASTFLPNRGGLGVEARPGAVPNAPIGKTENPLLRSGIALAGANQRKSGNEDGVLTALETAGLNLSGTKLVVFSACETGLGDVANGEGVYGLRRALSIAGAESQVISLWKVSDDGTKDLMVSYYKRLMNNGGRSEALRQTQLEMLSNPNYQHPFYWAAFIPSGDWTPMSNQ
jgi:CHAT domain-containing protein/Tfp pilus assembly protein PilF